MPEIFSILLEAESILVSLSFVSIAFWIFRPNSKKKYEKYSMIPFESNDNNKDI